MAKYNREPFSVKTKGDLSTPSKDQFAITYDALSEGPIEGLADGLSSIFINDVPVIQQKADNILKPRRFDVTNTTAATITHAQFGEIDALEYQNKTGLDIGTRFVIIEKAGATGGTGIASTTAGEKTVTTSSSFFTDAMTANRARPVYLRIAGAGKDGTEFVTKVQSKASATSVTVKDIVPTTVSNADISFDHFSKISSISGNVATLETAPLLAQTATSCQVTSPQLAVSLSSLYNYDNIGISFRTGNKIQTPAVLNDAFGQASVVVTPNTEIRQADLRDAIDTTGNLSSETYNDDELDEVDAGLEGGTADDTVYTDSFLNVSNPSEVDEIHLMVELPQCHATKASSGAVAPSYVELQIFFEFSNNNGTDFTSVLMYGPTNNEVLTRTGPKSGKNVNFIIDGVDNIPNDGYIKPSEAQYTSFIEEFVINTQQFQPYDNFRLRIRRINAVNFKDASFQHKNPCRITTIESIIKDKLSYPYTSYGALQFNAKDFNNSLPVRSYLLKGRKVKVPTNYRTREETGGAAAYTRNVSSGATESTYQNWDGNFRGDKSLSATSPNYGEVYTDNPVWIFYDLLTNDRYGLGQFISEDQIDKYELFRLARYCDEEVSDGKGGTEPRFTCNVYLTKTAEATQVIKQFASIFRGMALWRDGQISAIADRPQEPIYTFTKANVKDGLFTYEGTGERIKTNQVKVTWNDPNDNYRQSVEYVEDHDALADLTSPRIIREDLLAFGTTSRAQAHRLGKWKLLSAQNELETVSFNTGLNAAGLRPGDVIAVQDADRDRGSYSGRVSNTGTKNTTTIPLDRSVTLPSNSFSSGFPPQLLLIYPSGGAYLDQDSATISSTTYSRGDLITSITSSTAASNQKDDSNNKVNIFWSENVRVEVQTIHSSTGTGSVSSIVAASAFSAAPDAEVMWALKIFNADGTEATGSVKEYKVVSVKENTEDSTHEIVGTAYFRNKYDIMERGFVIPPEPTATTPDPEAEVPAPANLQAKIIANEDTDEFGIGTHDVLITWDFPLNSDGKRYEFAQGFEVRHSFKGKKGLPEFVDVQQQSLRVQNVKADEYNVSVRTVSNIKTYSLFVDRTFNFVVTHFTPPVSKNKDKKIAKGGLISAPLGINSSTGTLTFGDGSVTHFNFQGADGTEYLAQSASSVTTTVSGSGGDSSGLSTIVMRKSGNNLVASDIRTFTDSNSEPTFEYFGANGSSDGLQSSGGGTITVEENSNKIVGSSTSFTSALTVGEFIKIENGSSTTQATGATAANTTTITLSGSNSNIKIGQTVTGGTALKGLLISGSDYSDPGEVYVVNISGTTLTVNTPVSIANGTTLTFTPRPVYRFVNRIESNTLAFLDEIVERKYSAATFRRQLFVPQPTDTIVATAKRVNVLGTNSFSLLFNFTDFPVANNSLTIDRISPNTIVTESEGIGSNDNDTTLPTSAAVKDYVDSNSSGGTVDTTGTPADNQIAVFTDSNTIEGDSKLTFDGSTLALTGSQTISSNLTVTGDLTVNGTTTTLNTATLDVEDKNITLNYGAGDTSASANNAGITIQDAVNSTTDASLLWNTSLSAFKFSNTLHFDDGIQANFGTSSDLQILHDGTHSYIKDVGTGSLRIRGTDLLLESQGGETFLYAANNGAVTLYHDNAAKLATTTTGIDIGTFTSTGTTSLNLKAEAQHDTKLGLFEDNANYGFSLNYDGGLNDFIIRRHDNSASGVDVLTLNREDNNATFAGAITSSGQLTVTTSSDDLAVFRDNTDHDVGIVLEKNPTTDYALMRLNGTNGDGRYIIGYGSTHSNTANQIAIKNLVNNGQFYYQNNDGGIIWTTGNQGFNLKVGSYEINGVDVIDSSRNLLNIVDATINGEVGIGTTPSSTWKTIIQSQYPLQLKSNTGTATYEFYAQESGTKEFRLFNSAKVVGYNQNLVLDTNSANTHVRLNSNGVNKLATTSTGIDVTGNITVGDSHTIGDDVNDNLEIASSTGENILINSANQVYLQTGGSTKLETTTSGISVTGTISSGDITVNDQIIASGDSDTYLQFHAADQFRVVTGGAERLEVNTSETKLTAGNLNVISGQYLVNGQAVITNARALTNISSISSTYLVADATKTASKTQIRATGWYGSASSSFTGTGVEIGGIGTNGTIIAYDRDASVYRGLNISATAIGLDPRGGSVNITAGGDLTFNGVIVIDENRDLENIGTIDASQTLTLNASGTNDTSIEIGANTASNHYAYIDLVGDATYSDYGLRIIRNNGGANTSSFIYHRGTGNFNIETQDSASIKLRTAGTDALTVDTLQRVGIGTSSPDAQFHLEESSVTPGYSLTGRAVAVFERNAAMSIVLRSSNTGTSSIDFADAAAQAPGRLIYDHSNNSTQFVGNGSERMRIDSSGRVGIGTTVPSTLLHLYANDPTITLDDSGTAATIKNASGNIYYNTSSVNRDHIFQGAGTEKIRLTGDGLLGIGTSSPATDLAIVKSTSPTLRLERSGASQLDIIASTAAAGSIIDAQSNHLVVRTSTAEYIAFETNDTERMRIDSSGNVGIGTDLPSYKLSVHHDTTNVVGSFTSGDNQVWINLNDDGGGTYGCLIGHDSDAGDLFTIADNGVNKRIRVTENGNVCIGSTSPAFTSGSGLEIERGGTTTLRLQNTAAAKTVEFNMGTDLEIKCLNTGSDIILTPTANVGIGATPTVKLDIANSEAADVTLRIGNSRAYGIGQGTHGAALLLGKIESSTDQPMAAVRGRPSTEDSSSFGDLIFETRASGSLTERMRIASGLATLYVGTTSASFRTGRNANEYFELNVTDGNGNISYIQDETGAVNHMVNFNITSSSTGLQRFNFNKDVNLGAGESLLSNGTTVIDSSRNFSAGSAYKIGSGIIIEQQSSTLYFGDRSDNDYDVNLSGFSGTSSIHLTDTEIYMYGTTTSNSQFLFTDSGHFHANNNITAFSTSVNSDIKLKDNISTINNSLNTVMALRGVDFTWKRDGKKAKGFIAQEIEKVLPELVEEAPTLGSDEKHKTVNYEAVIPVLVEAIKELKAEIEELKKK